MELDDGFWITLEVPEAGLEQCNEESDEEPNCSGPDHDEAALRRGFSVGRNSRINDLDQCALLCLVQLGNLELPRKDIENRLVILDVP